MLEGKYTNKFSIIVNPAAGETIITFAQAEQVPQVDTDSGKTTMSVERLDVSKVAMSIQTAKELVAILGDCIKRSESGEKNE